MSWPNKITLNNIHPYPTYRYWDFWENIAVLEKWCLNNLSSKGVLWISKDNYYSSDFYFAQSQDAVMFRLSNGV